MKRLNTLVLLAAMAASSAFAAPAFAQSAEPTAGGGHVGVIGGLDMEVSGLAAETAIVVGPYQALRTLADGTAISTLRK